MIKSIIYISPFGRIRLLEKNGFLTNIFFERKYKGSHFTSGNFRKPDSQILKKTVYQLDEYFSGRLKNFDIPIKLVGSNFQISVWKSLMKIPYGEIWTYSDQAHYIKKPNAMRAVGNANSKNPIPIIIPCHRVISKNGFLSGFSGGVEKKSYLIELEKKLSSNEGISSDFVTYSC